MILQDFKNFTATNTPRSLAGIRFQCPDLISSSERSCVAFNKVLGSRPLYYSILEL